MSKQVVEMSDRVDKWLKETLPQAEEDGARPDVQLAILKERLRNRKSARQRRRKHLGMAAVPLVVLVVFFGDIVELGGDSFEMVEVESSTPEPGKTILENEFRGGGIGFGPQTTEEAAKELTLQIEGGEGTVSDAYGFSIGGVTNWTIRKQNVVRGEIHEIVYTPLDPPSGRSRALLDFVSTEWTELEKEIESGSRQPTGNLIKALDGIPIAFEYWVIHSKKFGEVTYYKGVPIR